MIHNDTNVAFKQAITSALNATQGHKRSYQTNYYFGPKCHTGTQTYIFQTSYYFGSKCHTETQA